MKTQIVLDLYDSLLNGETIDRDEFCSLYFISERTFYRYAGEVSAHLRQTQSEYYLYEVDGAGKYLLKKKEKPV